MPAPFPAADPPIVEAPARADVVVIGAGPPGLAVATVLARAGTDVVVVVTDEVPGIGAAFFGLAEHPWRLAASLGAVAAGDLFRFAADGLRVGAERLGAPTGGE